MTFLVINSEWI